MNAVILLGLVIMWAVVLVPMWLRRHDEVEETRSVDRFSSAMHTLSRKDTPADKKYVVMPHRSSTHEVHVSGASAPRQAEPRRGSNRTSTRTSTRTPSRRPEPKQAMTAAERRRRTLFGLLAVTVVTLVAAVVLGGIALWALQVLVDVVLVSFVGYLGKSARQLAAQPARRRPVAAPRRAPKREPVYADDEEYEDFEPVAVRASVPEPVAEPEPLFDQTAIAEPEQPRERIARRLVFDDLAPEPMYDEPSYAEATSTGSVYDQPSYAEPAYAEPSYAEPSYAEAASSQPACDEPAAVYDPMLPDPQIDVALSDPVVEPEIDNSIGSRPWEPVPVPRPMYSSKPAAPRRTPRVPVFEPLLPPIETAAELDPVDDLEEILDRRWAVND